MSAAAAAGNNTPAAKRVPGRPWKPGQSGNPNGRPKGLAALSKAVRDKIDPDTIADLWWEMATDPERRDADRLEALRMLADRGWGRAADFAPITEEDPLGVAESRDRLVGRLQAVPASDDSAGESPAPPPAATDR